MSLKEHYATLEYPIGIPPTDKGNRNPVRQHFYMDVYDRLFSHLQHEPIQLLELGVETGSSIYLWATFFKNGTISGVDLNFPEMVDSLLALGNVNLFRGDAYNTFEYVNHNIIIDDADHNVGPQAWALEHYGKLVKTGGFYIVEDMITDSIPEMLAAWKRLGRKAIVEIHDHSQANRPNTDGYDVLMVFQFLD